MRFEPLPLLATLALFAQWKFASPFLPSPTLRHGTALLRQSPLMLFTMAGLLLSIALPNFERTAFIAALGAGTAMLMIGVVLAYRR